MHNQTQEQKILKRAADWRNGAVVYQVIVDRFAPSKDIEKKKSKYPKHSKLKKWYDSPRKGNYNKKAGVWSHELDFWGGDLESLENKLDYIRDLQIDVLYLNPIFLSMTNHKYDTWDYSVVDPVYGNREDLFRLCEKVHEKDMKIVLDGVINHMGVKSPIFQTARDEKNSPYRDYFKFTDDNQWGYIGWMDVENLPELNLGNKKVRDYLYKKKESIIQSYIRYEDIDGWRLDVAHDLGFSILNELTLSAHKAKPGSLIIGEIYNYPEEWFPSVDGVMNMHGRLIINHLVAGKLTGSIASSMWETMIEDSGIENILKSWLVLDNHDNERLASLFPSQSQFRMARILQFTLPGSPCLYYGSEVGMIGMEDPEQRGSMRWDLVKKKNSFFKFHKELLTIRKKEKALKYGDFRRLHSEKLFAFMRSTDSVYDTIVVVANPTGNVVKEFLQLRESKFQDVTTLKDLLSKTTFTVHAGTIEVSVPAGKVLVLKADISKHTHGYNRYDRMK